MIFDDCIKMELTYRQFPARNFEVILPSIKHLKIVRHIADYEKAQK